MNRSAGLTLLELLVTVTMLTLVTYLAASAFPIVREEEALKHASQQIISALRAVQVQALDEQRSHDCLTQVGEDPLDAKRCSDLGIMLRQADLVTFADTNDNNRFDDRDFPVQTTRLARTVQVTEPVSLLVEATPPNIVLYVNGTSLSADESTDVLLRAVTSRSRQRTVLLSISAYGVVER